MKVVEQRLEIISNLVSKYYHQGDTEEAINEFTNTAEQLCGAKSSEIQFTGTESSQNRQIDVNLGADLEIVLRELMAKLVLKYNARQIADHSSSSGEVHQLIQFSIGCGLYSIPSDKLGAISKRIPFLLLEDLLEAQTVDGASALWSVIESLTARLTHPDIFSKGSNILLRMCNSLLRRISKSCHTELCGRVLMFLAAIFPISERSAVNPLGKINVSNATSFEDESTYNTKSVERARERLKLQVQHESETEDQLNIDEMYMDVADASSTSGDGNDANFFDRLQLPYSSYQTFWQLQSYFAGASPSHETLIKKVEHVLKLFDENAPPPLDLHQETEKLVRAHAVASNTLFSNGDCESQTVALPKVSQEDNQSGSNAYLGCKFLTSSELFTLQLRDPLLRQQVSTQVLFLTHSIRHQARAGALGSLSVSLLNAIKQVEKRAISIVENTPQGAHLNQIILKLMFREGYWIKWKMDGCQSFERKKLFTVSQSENLANDRNITRKTVPSSEATGKGYNFGKTFDEALGSARALVSSVPSYSQHLERYVDAEDPDAGIDAAYHPKHEADYCWRARRLLAAEHLASFHVMPDGDIGRGLKIIGGTADRGLKSVVDVLALSVEAAVTDPILSDESSPETVIEVGGAESNEYKAKSELSLQEDYVQVTKKQRI